LQQILPARTSTTADATEKTRRIHRRHAWEYVSRPPPFPLGNRINYLNNKTNAQRDHSNHISIARQKPSRISAHNSTYSVTHNDPS
jgi:hypothetical protein